MVNGRPSLQLVFDNPSFTSLGSAPYYRSGIYKSRNSALAKFNPTLVVFFHVGIVIAGISLL